MLSMERTASRRAMLLPGEGGRIWKRSSRRGGEAKSVDGGRRARVAAHVPRGPCGGEGVSLDACVLLGMRQSWHWPVPPTPLMCSSRRAGGGGEATGQAGSRGSGPLGARFLR